MKLKTFTKTALSISVVLLILWAVLGAGTTIAWYTDTTPTTVNSFVIGDLDVDLFYRDEITGNYLPVEADTKLFPNEDLYEPGFTKTIYLKIVNNSIDDIQYRLSIHPDEVTKAQSVLGNEIYLPNYLQFGAVVNDREVIFSDRDPARDITSRPLTSFTAQHTLGSKSDTDNTDYVALVVYMPEEVGNEANYRGDKIPTIDMGITLLATQMGVIDRVQ